MIMDKAVIFILVLAEVNLAQSVQFVKTGIS